MADGTPTPNHLSLKEAREHGSRFYWSDNACKNGHSGLRYTAGRRCLECSKVQSAADFASRPEHHAAKSKHWYSDRTRSRKKTAHWRARNKERNLDNQRKYAARNKPKLATYRKEWAAQNRDKCLSKTREWYKRNQKKQQLRGRIKRASRAQEYQDYSREYNRTHRPLVAVHARNRRARKLSNGGKHTIADIRNLFALQRGKCPYCTIDLGAKYHVDHIQPLARGGSNGKKNLQLLCGPCNQSKSARDPIEFMQERGMLL